ncbi:hypothetical protein CkaCkLH20_06713 [Colletotrichum karsti]|uniref:Uncharacterized protein n=1 Tax=Colletotrichum karsti TaxID=1095194 RepID=A0A9P6I886_9PEZI|nr:uncharacterized protein CkaCkLH20_06713 [Colletotrichum karsti]KAF9875781.1 hypothetical protein CkaCkLH20_06713 [Colletotrichum karsti]
MASLGSSSGFSSTPQSFHALLSGKSVPRSLTRIHKNQQKLLDRSDSWFMGIKGNNEDANVPPEVIQSLKDFHTAHTLPPPAQKPQPPVSSAPSLTAPAKSQTVNTFSDGADGSPVSSAPGTPVSWPSSPERPGISGVGNSSPCLSIKSQLGVESQLPPPSPIAGLPSSPPRYESSPIAPAPKRPNPPAGLLQPSPKRPRIGTFPSSSAGLDDELETCIPDAIDQATPWTNKAAARLLTASQAVTSPPCGQGSMIPSTYNDAKSPAKSSTPKKRRNMKVISAADWSSSAPTVADEPIIPLSQPRSREKVLPASSGAFIASTYATESRTPQENQVVQDTPGQARTHEEERQGTSGEANNHEEGRQDISGGARNIEEERPSISSGLGTIHEENQSVPGRLRAPEEERQVTPVRPAGLEQNLLQYQATLSANPPEVDVVMGETSGNPPLPELMVPDEEELREDLRSWLDDVWGMKKLDWLPVGLQQHRTRLSRSSLETLKRITLLAEKRAINLGSLWSQPDGPLRQASQHSNGRLSFPDDLSHESIEFLVQTARQAEQEKKEKRDASLAKAAAAAARLERRVNSAAAEKLPTMNVEDNANANATPAPPSGPSDETIAEQFTRSPYEAFCAAYPSYSGSLMDFVRACLVVEYIQRKQTLPKWLYDDFIRAFGDGYIQYMDRMDKAIPPEKPITAVKWYVGNVDRPVFQRNVVTVESLSRVFEIYPDESKSASSTISPEVSPSPATAKLPTALPTNLPATDRNDAHITSPSPGDRTKPAQIAASVPVPSSPLQTQGVPEAQRTVQDEQPRVQEQKTTSEHPNPAASSDELKLSPVNREKGKQRMVDENTPEKHVSATPKMQRQEAAIDAEDDNVVFLSSNRQKAATPTEDDNVVFISSNPRLRPAPPKFVGQQASIKHEPMQGPNPPFPTRATPPQVPAASEQVQRVASIAETRSSAQKPMPSASRANLLRPTPEKPHARRTLPSSFNFGTPSRQASHSPARSTLSATTQDSRVKKPKKTEKDRQRDNERWKRKIERMAREGRLPGSTPAPKGGDA